MVWDMKNDLQFPVCAAIRGRYKNNRDNKAKQHLEIRLDGIINCISTFSKDTLIIERKKK